MMSIFKRKESNIPEGNYRIIKIGKDAIYEVLREYIMDHGEIFFEVTDATNIVAQFDMDWDSGKLICVARNAYKEDEHLQFPIDTQVLLPKLQDTTDSMFADKRYIELSEEEIKNL